MHKKYIVRLTDEEREYPNGPVTKGKTVAYKIRHANILLKADEDGSGWGDERIAEAFSAHKKTIAGIRQRSAVIPAGPGKPERTDYEYERNGTADISMFTEPLGGQRYVSVTERRTSSDRAVAMCAIT